MVTNFDKSSYDVHYILVSITFCIFVVAKRLKVVEHAQMTIDGQRTNDEMSSQLTVGIIQLGRME